MFEAGSRQSVPTEFSCGYAPKAQAENSTVYADNLRSRRWLREIGASASPAAGAFDLENMRLRSETMRSELTAAVPRWSHHEHLFHHRPFDQHDRRIRRSASGGRRQPGYRRKVDTAIAHQSAVQWRKPSRNAGAVADRLRAYRRTWWSPWKDTQRRTFAQRLLAGGQLSQLCGLRADAAVRDGSDATPRAR